MLHLLTFREKKNYGLCTNNYELFCIFADAKLYKYNKVWESLV